MPFALWTLLSLVAYVAGLTIVMRVTPLLLMRSYDEGLFMGIAAADVVGGILAFGAVAITFGMFSGQFAVRVLDFFLLIGILIVAGRAAYLCFWPRVMGTNTVSRIAAGCYCVFLLVAALCYIILLFAPS